MSLRIGLLQCDHVANDLMEAHGNYPEMFEEMLLAEDPNIEMAVYDLTADCFPVDLSACDGYLITGSQFSVYDDIPWINKAKQLIRELYQEKIPTVGICFGHQLIAESLGGKVNKATDKGWGVGILAWNTENDIEWMGENVLGSFSLCASHQDQVTVLPMDAKLIASSDFCPIAGFQVSDHFLSFQGHPEFSKEYTQALISKRIDRIGKVVSDAGIKTLKGSVDSKAVVAWIVGFIKKEAG